MQVKPSHWLHGCEVTEPGLDGDRRYHSPLACAAICEANPCVSERGLGWREGTGINERALDKPGEATLLCVKGSERRSAAEQRWRAARRSAAIRFSIFSKLPGQKQMAGGPPPVQAEAVSLAPLPVVQQRQAGER